MTGDADLSGIPVDDIEEIQIIKGGADTKFNYSGAIGGVINIITKKDKKDSVYISSQIFSRFYYPDQFTSDDNKFKEFSRWYDFFDTQSANVNFRFTRDLVSFRLFCEGNRAANNFIYSDETGVKRRRDGNGIWDVKASTGVLLNLPYRVNIDFSGSFYFGDKNIPGPVNNKTPGHQRDYAGGGSFLFESKYVGTDRIRTEFIADYKFQSISWDQVGLNSIHNVHTLFITDRWTFKPTGWLDIGVGGDFSYDFADSSSLGQIHNYNGGGYVNFEFNISNKVIITQSNKLVYSKLYPIFIPKIGLVVNINDEFQFKHNIFRSFKNPSLNDLYWPSDNFAKGNPNLLPEDGIGTDFIISYQRPKVLRAESSIYFNYLHNSINWQPSGGKWSPVNLGEMLVFGSEHEITTDFSKYIEISAAYHFCYTLVSSGEDKSGSVVKFADNKRAVYKPVHTLNFGVNIRWNSGNLLFSGVFVSERYSTILNVSELKPYFTFDIDFKQRVGIVTLFATFKNIFNYFYFTMDGYPATNGSFITGIKVEYEKLLNQKKQ